MVQVRRSADAGGGQDVEPARVDQRPEDLAVVAQQQQEHGRAGQQDPGQREQVQRQQVGQGEAAPAAPEPRGDQPGVPGPGDRAEPGRHLLADIIILDLGLPDMGGTEMLTRIRGWSTMPVIVLSARTAEVQKVAALDAGADDYVTKPFNMNELPARLRAALRDRRPGPDQPGHALAAFA
jgi:DNA-binding response OmpR family regulator